VQGRHRRRASIAEGRHTPRPRRAASGSSRPPDSRIELHYCRTRLAKVLRNFSTFGATVNAQ
jgi:hypothetical protein